MIVTVTQIANELSITQNEVIALLHQQGIIITNVNSSLTESDYMKIKNSIQLKNQRLEDEILSQKEQDENNLEYYFANYKIFIDTCSLLHLGSDNFWLNAEPLIRKYGNKIIIPSRVVDEIKKHSTNNKNRHLSKKSTTVLSRINHLLDTELIDIRGEKNDDFADNVFLVQFTKHRMKHQLLLITQDNNLAKDILNINETKSVIAKTVTAQQINQYGYLSNFIFNKNNNIDVVNDDTTSIVKPPSIVEKFATSISITDITDVELTVSHIPSEGDIVFVQYEKQQQPIKLLNAISCGGEGTIYTTDYSYIAKIYKKEKITKRKYDKINLMLSKKISYDGICYPIACIYNKYNQFVGYIMPAGKGKELQKSLFIKPLLIKNFPNWKKRDTVELCITILEKIKYLHDRNIVIGDINPTNILVVSTKEVYFVDTDSYQIEGFPCPVGTINYTAPEIQKKPFNSFIRTLGNENFAIATLLFMIMLPGKPPYSQQGGENPIDNIVNMDFSYPFCDQSNKKTPDGPWRYIWSHLPYEIKESFFQTFRKEGKNSSENERYNVDEWLKKFRYYLQLLDSGKFGEQDEMSEELFPTRHKKNPNAIYITCKICKVKVPEEICKSEICRECLNKGETYYCKQCRKDIIFTNYQKYISNAKKHEICQECFEKGNAVYRIENCWKCLKNFEITINEKKYFKSKNLDLPRKCPKCRKIR